MTGAQRETGSDWLFTRRRRLAVAGTMVVLAVAVSACRIKAPGPDLVDGKRLFVQKCGACHTLARARTSGVTGPNLDDAFRQSRADGLKSSTIRGVVEGQIRDPNRDGAMPAKLVTGDAAYDVAAYVAKVAAVPGKDTGKLAQVGQARGGPPGRRLFTGPAGCGSCHVLADAGTAGTTGPNLDKALKGKSPAFIRQSIVDPNAIVAPGYQPDVMPPTFATTLSRQELSALVAYLAKVTK